MVNQTNVNGFDAPIRHHSLGACENSHGAAAKFEGFGHKFCWACYSQWILCYNASSSSEVEREKHPQIPLF